MAKRAALSPSSASLERARQPLHVVYGGGHLFGKDTLTKLGALAQRSFATYAPDASSFGEALGLAAAIAPEVHARVARKLAAAPIEDYRIDFEDGYGVRSDGDEDAHVDAAARALAEGHLAGVLPMQIGFRIKSLAPETRERAVRTLERFLIETVGAARKLGAPPLPPRFVVTLPKVRSAVEVEVLATLLEALEAALSLRPSERPPSGLMPIGVELMIEQPEAILADDGCCPLIDFVRAAGGRCTAVHFGTYDYTASLGIAAHEQKLAHPAADFAKHMMQVALAGSGVALSDGATTTLPIEPHRGPDVSSNPELASANRRAIHGAWRLHADNVRHGLAQGFYQGWDLHPSQIPARYGAVFAFYREAAPAMEARLRGFLDRAAQATRLGQAFDDAATGQGLLNFFDRAITSGALDEAVLHPMGLSLGAIEGRSFTDLTGK